MARAVASNTLTLLIPLLLALAGVLAWGQSEFRGPGPLTAAYCVEVPPGTRLESLSERLGQDGVIANPTIFRLGADYTERADDLKAGSFLVQAGPR